LGWITVSLSPLDVLGGSMSVTGLCQICENETADHSCDLCGRVVCDKHFSQSNSICTACLGESGGRPDGEPVPEDMPDGVDTYEF
jgi:hypothetical protein